jgi:hypothetical protein
VFESNTTEFFTERERIHNLYRYAESISSAAPKATFPQAERYCRKKLNLAGTNKIPCASKDRMSAEIRCTFWGNDEDMRFA